MSQRPSTAVPETLVIDGARAVVEWVGADGQTQYLFQRDNDASRQVTLDVYFDASTNTALLKLKAMFGLKAPSGFKTPSKNRTPLFLYIHGDTIASLTHDVPGACSETVTTMLGSASHRLQLSVARPAQLIAPQFPVVPQNKAHGEMFDSFKLLAQETRLAIYFAHPSLSQAALDPLCKNASAGNLKPLQEATNLQGLYKGQGGRVLDGIDLCLPSKGASLPSYDEISPGKSATPLQSAGVPGPSVKRRRGSASDNKEGHDMALVAATCTTIVEGMMSRFRQEQQAHLESQLQAFKTSVSADIEQLRTDVMEHITARLNDFENSLPSDSDVDNQISQHVGSFEDLMDVKIDDCVTGIKVELEEFVDNEVVGIEDRVMQRIREASWTLNLEESTT